MGRAMSLDDLRAQAKTLAADLRQLDTDRYAAELAFQSRMESLSVRAGALSAALQAYNPDPVPPAPAQPVKYGRFLHEVDNTFSIDTQVDRWALQVIQGDQWHMPLVQALTARPGTLVLRASTPVARRPGDQPGDSTCLPPGQIPDAWLLKNAQNQVITRTRDNDSLVDVGNASYQDAAAAYLIDRCKREHYHGVWLDEINADPRWAFPGAMPAKYPTLEKWQAALGSFVNTMVLKLRAAGIQVWINLAGNYGDLWTRSMAQNTDGHCIEFYVARGHEPLASTANPYWRQVFDWTLWQARQPIAAMYNAQTTDSNLVRYALATYLLAAGEDSCFMAGADPYGVAQTIWTGDMTNARKLGAPLGGYQVDKYGLFFRDFEHGRVSVNPGTSPINTMPATSGLIELR